MARKSTGTLVRLKSGPNKGCWQGQVTLADGTRKRLPPFPRGTSEAMARAKTEAAAERVQREGIRRPPKSDPRAANPNSAWFEAWATEREARGLTSVRENRAHYTFHILPSIGDKHIRTWTRDDMRKLSADLDTKVQAGLMAWKTARNVWGTATRMCGDAAVSKHEHLRVRDDDPSFKVPGPERGAVKEKQFIYPSEFLTFITAESTPVAWRRILAVAVYTYLREGELRELKWTDVDFEHGTIHIARARDRRDPTMVKPTKGRRNRRIPIEPGLLPLLVSMKAIATTPYVLESIMPSHRDMARGLLRWLRNAGVTRTALYEDTATVKKLTFHDARSTGITWMAVRGDDPIKIQRRAGHRHFATTDGYIRLAESVSTGFGAPFPNLGAHLELFGFPGPESHAQTHEAGLGKFHLLGTTGAFERGGRDLNPRPPA